MSDACRGPSRIETQALILVLLSGLIHPLRDLSLKGVTNPAAAYLGVSICWVLIAGVQSVASSKGLLLDTSVVPLVFFSGFGLAVYYYGTLAALQRGHLSIYYPIIRSSPFAVVVLNWALFDVTYSIAALIGIGLIVAAGFLLQKPAARKFDDTTALALAIVAMIGSAVYTLADSTAMKTTEPATYLFWSYLLVSALLAIAVLAHANDKSEITSDVLSIWHEAAPRIVIASVVSYLSYYLILIAFQLGADPASTSAVRQISIPVSVVMAAVILHETGFVRRLGWAALLAVGIIVLVTA